MRTNQQASMIQKPRTLRVDDETWDLAADLANKTGKHGVSVSHFVRNLIHAEAACRRRDAHKAPVAGTVTL